MLINIYFIIYLIKIHYIIIFLLYESKLTEKKHNFKIRPIVEEYGRDHKNKH